MRPEHGEEAGEGQGQGLVYGLLWARGQGLQVDGVEGLEAGAALGHDLLQLPVLRVREASGPHGGLQSDLLDYGEIQEANLEMLPELSRQLLQGVRLYDNAPVEGAEWL